MAAERGRANDTTTPFRQGVQRRTRRRWRRRRDDNDDPPCKDAPSSFQRARVRRKSIGFDHISRLTRPCTSMRNRMTPCFFAWSRASSVYENAKNSLATSV